jgi:hypothetical protein
MTGASETERFDKREAGKGSVLVVGVYLLNRTNKIRYIMERLSSSSQWNVVQKWAALGSGDLESDIQARTFMKEEALLPKFTVLNRLINSENLDAHEFVLVCDDDISFPHGFLDAYLDRVLRYNFSLAQPARTLDSYIDHYFVAQMGGLEARWTRFVEIGPFFSIRRDAYERTLPFDESSPMGWGYDFIWPCIIEELGLRMGIIDATPVQHSMRKPVENYNYDDTVKVMEEFLSDKKHLSLNEACRILESYA